MPDTSIHTPVASTAGGPATEPAPATRSTNSGNVDMVPVSFEQWQDIRASHIPAILVVDLWASWCVPCLERFPEMIRMSREYQQRGVHFVSLSLDDRDDLDSIMFANEFLKKNQPPFNNYFLDEDIIDGFEKLDILGVPAVEIYARDGSRAYRLTGDNPNAQFTEDDVENAIKALLQP